MTKKDTTISATFEECTIGDDLVTVDLVTIASPSIPKNNEKANPKPVKYTNGMKHRVTLSLSEFMELSKIYVASLMDCSVTDIESVTMENEDGDFDPDDLKSDQFHYTFKQPMTKEVVASAKRRAGDSLKDRKIDLNL